MGCDIHGWVEKKIDKKWIAISELKDRNRNYSRFAKLAGVRGEGPEAKGIPPDISETTKYHVEDDGPDGHNHSHIELTEGLKIFKETSGNEHYSEYDMAEFEFETDDYCHACRRPLGSPYRLVFWFDN